MRERERERERERKANEMKGKKRGYNRIGPYARTFLIFELASNSAEAIPKAWVITISSKIVEA